MRWSRDRTLLCKSYVDLFDEGFIGFVFLCWNFVCKKRLFAYIFAECFSLFPTFVFLFPWRRCKHDLPHYLANDRRRICRRRLAVDPELPTALTKTPFNSHALFISVHRSRADGSIQWIQVDRDTCADSYNWAKLWRDLDNLNFI